MNSKYAYLRGHGKQQRPSFDPQDETHRIRFDIEGDNLDRINVIAGALETISAAADLSAVKSAAATALRELKDHYHLDHDMFQWGVVKGYWCSWWAHRNVRRYMQNAHAYLPTATDAQFRKVVRDVAWAMMSAYYAEIKDGETSNSRALYTRANAGTMTTQVGGVGIQKIDTQHPGYITGVTPTPTCRIRWGPPDPTHADHFDSDRATDDDKGFIPWARLPSARITSTTANAPFVINLNNPTPKTKKVYYYCWDADASEGGGGTLMTQHSDIRIDVPRGCEVRFSVQDIGATTAPPMPMAATRPDPAPTEDAPQPPDPNAPIDTDDDDGTDDGTDS